MKRLRLRNSLYNGVIALMFLTFGTSVTCIAQDDEAEWSYPIYEKGARSLMNSLHEQWRLRDGAATFEIADILFWALLLDPNAFYVEFSRDSLGYQRFADRLDALVFTNLNDTTTGDLENLRKTSIWRLEEMTFDIELEYVTIHQEMIESLKRVKVSFID